MIRRQLNAALLVPQRTPWRNELWLTNTGAIIGYRVVREVENSLIVAEGCTFLISRFGNNTNGRYNADGTRAAGAQWAEILNQLEPTTV